MSAARVVYIAVFLAALLVVAALFGCSSLEPKRSGTAVANQPPEMFIVNIPPDGAQFSRNPELRWYATDKDGFISFFRYAVVVESLMVVDGHPASPEEFIANAGDQQFGWDTLRVNLDNPQSTATVRLYANIDFPVDSFVNQYFFIQAQDDKGAKSDIKFRRYSRNNHYPNTKFRAGLYYINAKDASSPAPGIDLSWQGFDSTDWGRAEPPLEYEWRLYGPFEAKDPVYVKIVKENCIYDPTGDSFVACINVPVLDLENLPPAVQGVSQPLVHSQGPNFANDTTDVWVTDNRATIYNVYKNLKLDTTSQYKFIFWVRARDDGYTPDPTPAFGQFPVYEAKFERPVLVLDETFYLYTAGRQAPKSLYITWDYWKTLIYSCGYVDTLFDTIKDYRMKTEVYGSNLPKVDPLKRIATFMDIFSHRVLVLYNDDVTGELNESRDFGFMWWVFQGMDMGGSGLIMARNLGAAGGSTHRNDIFFKSAEFAAKFGISQVNMEGWYGDASRSLFDSIHIYNEEFIAAYPNVAGYPYVQVDYGPGSRLDSLYFRFPPVGQLATHVCTGLPEVGVGKRTPFAAPLYLYQSKDGNLSIFNGKVVGVAQQIGDVRSACFMFSPVPMKQDSMQALFKMVLDWLEAKFEDGGAALKIAGIPSYSSASASVAERRARLKASAEYMQEYADPEYLKSVGLTLPAYKISPTIDTEHIPATQPMY